MEGMAINGLPAMKRKKLRRLGGTGEVIAAHFITVSDIHGNENWVACGHWVPRGHCRYGADHPAATRQIPQKRRPRRIEPFVVQYIAGLAACIR
jgi:hypothetical protein